VVVLTDRTVLDRQLQDTIYQFEHKTGVVEKIDTDSAQLARALTAGVPIIISTIHKFGFIQDKVQALPDRRYAIIVDEAHSSQSGEMAVTVKELLSDSTLAAKLEAEGEDLSAPDQLALRAALFRGPQANMSFFAFTATPKFKTLELFGHKNADGQAGALPPLLHAPGHRGGLHPRRAQGLHDLQALLPARQVRRRRPGAGQAKGRLGAGPVRQPAPEQYRPEDRDHHRALPLLRDAPAQGPRQGHAGDQLPADGGEVQAGLRCLHQGQGLRGRALPGGLLGRGRRRRGARRQVHRAADEHPGQRQAHQGDGAADQVRVRCLPGAHRRQQVPDRLRPAAALRHVRGQAPGRHPGGADPVPAQPHPPGKEETFVLDFVNDRETILASFQDYYEATTTEEAVDPQRLYELQHELDEFQVYTASEIDGFAAVFYQLDADKRLVDNAKLNAWLDPAVDRFKALKEHESDEAGAERQEQFRGKLVAFQNLYGFLGQIVPFSDPDLEKRYTYARMLRRKLPRPDGGGPLDLGDDVVLQSYKLKLEDKGDLALRVGEGGPLPGPAETGSGQAKDDTERLSTIIEVINERFGTRIR
jgi:hypothetical protein